MRQIMLLVALILASPVWADSKEEGFVPLFNGKDLSGWVNVNGHPSTFFVKDGMIVTTGKPTGFLVDEDEWSSMIERINREKSQIRHESGAKSRVLPRKETPLTPEQLKKLEDDAKKTAPAGK